MSDAWLLRLGILVAGVILIAAIYFFGKPRGQGQGRGVGPGERGSRTEPTLGAQIESELAEAQETGGEAVVQAERERSVVRRVGMECVSWCRSRGSRYQ